MLYELSARIELPKEAQKKIRDWLESQEFSHRVVKRLPDGQFIDITDNPEYADIVKEILEKLKTNKS